MFLGFTLERMCVYYMKRREKSTNEKKENNNKKEGVINSRRVHAQTHELLPRINRCLSPPFDIGLYKFNKCFHKGGPSLLEWLRVTTSVNNLGFTCKGAPVFHSRIIRATSISLQSWRLYLLAIENSISMATVKFYIHPSVCLSSLIAYLLICLPIYLPIYLSIIYI